MTSNSHLLAALKNYATQYRGRIGVLVTAVVIPLLAWLVPSPFSETNDPAIYGRWESKYGYPDSAGMVNLHGVTEFLEDDSYRYTGFITLTTGAPPIDMVFRVNAAGSWTGDDERIVTKLTAMNSSLEEVRKGEIKLNGNMLAQTMKEPPKLESIIPMGSSERYKVVALEEDRIKLQVDNLQGEPIAFDMLKTPERNPGKLLPRD
ncbi:hypothetical protein SAMN05878276_1837 [Aquipseudomonas alcaligenes]|uniref:hypothetical protein n=1 Tax=Aquipseudomonas alcaligenes TaxID=43263 RepID=UPI000956C8F0|nr:hypothetical protein [Pseudomonas alcaligenes]SIS05825.1 hypothetical protein SAMN05878276_1837 [Pseudomonas alcaligenes]